MFYSLKSNWKPKMSSLPQQIQSPFSHLLLPCTALFQTDSLSNPKHPFLFTWVPPTSSTHSIINLPFLCTFIVSLPRIPAIGRCSGVHIAGGKRLCLYSLWSHWIHPSYQILPRDCASSPYLKKKNPVFWKNGKCDSLGWNRSDTPAPTHKKGRWVTLLFRKWSPWGWGLCIMFVLSHFHKS